MKYDEALKLWGAKKIAESYRGEVELDLSTVRVSFDFNEGYACCGGSDPSCYCSFAESPSAHVVIDATGTDGSAYRRTLDAVDFDFAAVLGEIVAAADGAVTI